MGWFDPGVHDMIVSALNSMQEISAMGSGAGAGYSGEKKKRTLIRREGIIMREEIIMEMKLRDLIRAKIGADKKVLKESVENKDSNVIFVNQRQKDEIDRYQMEHYLRKCVRKLLLQEKEELPPHRSTGINVLQDLLRTVIPSLKTGYKSLTTDIEQRSSFRSHIINAVVNSLAPIELDDEAGQELKEIDVDVKDDISADADKFLDIGDKDLAADADEEEKEAFQTLAGEDLTGRNVAMQAYDRVEKQIVDTYADLDNQQDQRMFYDYLIANLKLYFDRFEDQLQDELPEPSNAAYKQEKEKEEIGAEIGEVPPEEEPLEEPLEEVYSKEQRAMACARQEKEPEFAEMCTGPMKKKKKKKKSS